MVNTAFAFTLWNLSLQRLTAVESAGVNNTMLIQIAVLAWLLRTPLRLVLLRQLHAGARETTAIGRARMRLASRVAILELVALGFALAGTAVLADGTSWMWPIVVAGPMFAVALVYDVRSESRHLVPEVAGSAAVAAVAAMGTLAGGGSETLALGAWLILSARVFTSIPHVRAQVHRIHGREAPATPTAVGDVVALATAALAALLEPSLLLGAIGIVGLIVVQRLTLARPPRPAKVLGLRQMILGFAVVGLTALGSWMWSST